ncbi:DUF2460 domain-containing protein [Pseudomonas sp. JS3066]|uniref:DUF2460 domain-containing protein n=1 Tax=Pseudomonas sp. JS3066 TaxID=3090665 RepID=UPI002E7BD76A|nr:DUF2460 domain-containing protein [Pseudomonas sp. JS3066]WVK91134.1 DUF2460 domain-containing protein [Pseudomonas sp. JS3066]
MSKPFLEDRLPVCVRVGAQWDDRFFVNKVPTAGGGDYRSLKNPLMRRTFDISYILKDKALATSVASLYYRVWGEYAGFRVKAHDDFTTAVDGKSAYSHTDCVLTLISAGVYQLVKEYGRDGLALAELGRPKRPLYKPVASKIAVGIQGQALPAAQWSASNTTGQITEAANKSRTITAITKAAQAVATVGSHTFLVGESVVISGVVGMTQINGLRALIVAIGASTITLAINSTAFSTYTSGGSVQTRALNAGADVLTGGCEFDIPCYFDSAFPVTALEGAIRETSGLQLIEMLEL